MSALVAGLLFGLIAAAAGMLGGAIVFSRGSRDPGLVVLSLAFSSGFMLATALIRMIPESISLHPGAGLIVLGGYLLAHFFEHTAVPHLHFGEEIHADVMVRPAAGYSAFMGLLLHALFDGISIAAGFLVAPTLGVLIFLAVILHKVPEGFTVASIMVASGKRRGWALGSAGALGLATLLGVLAMSRLGGLVAHGLALSAGVTLYVAASDLIPEVSRGHGVRMALGIFAGTGTFFVAEGLLEMAGWAPIR